MNGIKFFKNRDGQQCALTDKLYKGYEVGNIPNRFGYMFKDDSEQGGFSQWFNYKGLTYIWE